MTRKLGNSTQHPEVVVPNSLSNPAGNNSAGSGSAKTSALAGPLATARARAKNKAQARIQAKTEASPKTSAGAKAPATPPSVTKTPATKAPVKIKAKTKAKAHTQASGITQSSVRHLNLALVAKTIFASDRPVLRAEVATITGLTRSTVSRLVDELLAAKVLRELEPVTAAGPGRPGYPLTPAVHTMAGLGLSANVDCLAGRVVDLAGQVLFETVLRASNAQSSPQEVLGELATLATSLATRAKDSGVKLLGVAIALPGLVDQTQGLLHFAPNLHWSEVDVPAVWDELDGPGGRHVQVRNDADLAALSTAYDMPGHLRQDTSFLFVTGDIGIGGSVVRGGEILCGRHGWGGEIGHITVNPDGLPCQCGSYGCLETVAGKAALKQAAGLPAEATDAELVTLLAAGDEQALTAVTRAGQALGQALAGVANVVELERVILGSGFAPLVSYLAPVVERELEQRVLSFPWSPIVVEGQGLVEPAAMGGAILALNNLLDNPAAVLGI